MSKRKRWAKPKPLYRRRSHRLSMPRRKVRTRRRFYSRPVRRVKRGILGLNYVSLFKKVAVGVGAGAIAALVAGYVAPQYKQPLQLVGAYAMGGIPGAAASYLISGGAIPGLTSTNGYGGMRPSF